MPSSEFGRTRATRQSCRRAHATKAVTGACAGTSTWETNAGPHTPLQQYSAPVGMDIGSQSDHPQLQVLEAKNGSGTPVTGTGADTQPLQYHFVPTLTGTGTDDPLHLFCVGTVKSTSCVARPKGKKKLLHSLKEATKLSCKAPIR